MNLSDREKNLATVLAVLLILTAAYYLIFSPLSDFYSRLKNNTVDFKAQSDILASVYQEYTEFHNQRTQINTILQDKNDNIQTLLQQIAATNNLTQNVAYIRRSQSNVQNKMTKITTEFKIEGAPIQSIIKTISDIETNGKLIVIDYVNISKGLKGTDKYDVLLKLNTFMAE